VQAPAVSGWGADFLKKNKESEAKANAAVAAEIEEQKGGAKGARFFKATHAHNVKRILDIPCHQT